MKWEVGGGEDIVQVEPKVEGDIVCCAPEGWEDSMELWPQRAPILAAAPALLSLAHEIADHLYEKQDYARCREMAKEIIAKVEAHQ